ncbi:proteoglycan Cow [Achroia grisella]|uniref:proteoglycan Cow n=1 Tax=Achroia grisella TaxID=688607 RepID=UPI0027D34362|nr:proteoglycan Cow [Achroia grisella]
MRPRAWAAALVAVAALAAADAASRRLDQDFEFDDDAETAGGGGLLQHPRRPRRYIYDPNNSLCQSLVCKKREVCVLRDAFTALCANKKELLRRGDVIVAATPEGWAGGGGAGRERDDDDEVFFDGSARLDRTLDDPVPEETKPDKCVGCPVRGRARFLCGSDNRTYSSLCRLDLHNCVRAAGGARATDGRAAGGGRAASVRPACRGFCPCGARSRPPPRRPRPHRARDRDEWRQRKLESSHNEVLSERSSRRRFSQGTEGCALDKMANRLLDWFSVLMEEAGATIAPEEGFPSDCKPEVRWMFAHLDTDGDGLLSSTNLYSLRHDERERCLRPFLSSCASGGDGGGGGGGGGGAGLGRAAWCGCLRRAARPCTALARAHPAPLAGAYVPACDARGFYRPRQCHAALGVCWCVDAHGVERAGSRTKGAPACPGDKSIQNVMSNETEAEAEASEGSEVSEGGEGVEGGEGAEGAEGAPADDEDAAGAASGDGDLRF